jgi:hypothetical protein
MRQPLLLTDSEVQVEEHTRRPRVGGCSGADESRRRASMLRLSIPTVSDTGIDPVVQGGTLEELLTGRAHEQIEEDPRWAQSLAVRDGGERLVLTLTDGLVDALAQASSERLAEVAVPWSETEEFWGAGDPSALTSQLIDLATLCRDARSRNDRVYCKVSV